MKAVEDWYDEPAADPDNPADGEFFDAPQSRIDLSKFPSKNGGLPIDVDLVEILAGGSGLASKPDAKDIAVSVATDLREFVTALLASLKNGDPSPILEWLTESAGDWVGDFPDWALGIGANFVDLLTAFQGTYTGADPALGTIQTIVQALRGGLTGLIDWSRIPQLSLSQLTNQPGPNLLTGFGDFADEDTMDGGGDWTWDGTVGGGSARTTGSGARKVLTSELVAVSEGQQMTAAGKVQWAAAAGTGAAMQLIVMPFVGDAAQTEVVISNITSPPASSSGNFVALSGSYTPAAGVTGVRVRITAEAALTAGTVWWDDVTLRKVATSLPQQFISGLTDALGDLGGWIKDLIEKLTGQARSSIEDAINDALTFGNQLKTILSGGSVGSPLPNLAGAVVGSLQTMLTQIGDLFAGAAVTPINAIVQGVKDWIASLTGWKSATTTKSDNIIDAITKAANGNGVGSNPLTSLFNAVFGVKSTADTAQAGVVDLREQLQAVSVTQQWVSLSTNDIASFPRVLLGLGVGGTDSGGAHTHGTTSATVSSTPSSHSHTANSAGSHSHSVDNEMPTLSPSKGTIGFVPLVVDRYCRPRYLKLITGSSGWSLFSIDYWYVGLYKYNPNDGNLYKIYDGGDQKGAITTAAKLHAFDMGTTLANLTPGEILFAAQLQNANALTSTRPIAGLWQPGLLDPSSELLAAPFYQLSGQSNLPTSVALSGLSANNGALPWMGVGTMPAAS